MVDPTGSFRRPWTQVVSVLVSLVVLLALFLVFRTIQATSSSGASAIVRPLAETPGSAHAILFSTANGRSADLDFIRGQLELQHYSVEALTSGNGGATALNFKAALTNHRGILFVAGNGAPDFLAVELLADAAICESTAANYVTGGTFTAGQITCRQQTLGFTAKGIKDWFQDAETIVYLSACDSISLQPSFTSARDFVGYQDCNGRPLSSGADTKFWGRLAGGVDGGRFRSTVVAAAEHDYGLGWQFRHRPQTVDTVLSPSVASIVPASGTAFPVAGTTAGQVVFDSRMDQTVDGSVLVSISGCSGTVVGARWVTTAAGYSAIAFTLQLNTVGTARLTVHAADARAARSFMNTLDGNTQPPGSDGVGPNGDDFVWSVDCIAGGGPPLPGISSTSTVTTVSPDQTTTSSLAPSRTGGTGAGNPGGTGTGGGSGGGGGGGEGGGGGGSGHGPGSTGPATTGVAPLGPTCAISALRTSPPPATQTATVQARAGLASISGVAVNNGTVSVPHFAFGTRSAVVVTATKADQTKPTEWSFDATDVNGRTTHCS